MPSSRGNVLPDNGQDLVHREQLSSKLRVRGLSVNSLVHVLSRIHSMEQDKKLGENSYFYSDENYHDG